jgi:MFS family permease
VKSGAGKQRSLRSIEWLNFFLADVQTGFGPFLAAYLAASGWKPGDVGFALSFGGLVTVAMQTPAGALVDAVHRKRTLLACSLAVLATGALILLAPVSGATVYAAQFLICSAGPFLAPTVAAMTLGIVGATAFSRQFGRNQAFNSAGNVFTALLIAGVSYKFGYRAIFAIAALLAVPAAVSLRAIDPGQIDYSRSRGGQAEGGRVRIEGLAGLVKDRALVCFLGAAFLFHLANAAMLPQLGELLSRGKPQAAAPFMSACIIVTQLVISLNAGWIGKTAGRLGRKPLLLAGFGVLPIRGALYTLTHSPVLLIGIQMLDGVANAIFGVVSILVISDLTRGSGRFNLASGALAAMVGLGAALSTTIGGQLIQHAGYNVSFLGLAAIALVAVTLLAVAVPETLKK